MPMGYHVYVNFFRDLSLFYKPLNALFTGDHLAASHNGELNYFEKYNWYSGRIHIFLLLLVPLVLLTCLNPKGLNLHS